MIEAISLMPLMKHLPTSADDGFYITDVDRMETSTISADTHVGNCYHQITRVPFRTRREAFGWHGAWDGKRVRHRRLQAIVHMMSVSSLGHGSSKVSSLTVMSNLEAVACHVGRKVCSSYSNAMVYGQTYWQSPTGSSIGVNRSVAIR